MSMVDNILINDFLSFIDLINIIIVVNNDCYRCALIVIIHYYDNVIMIVIDVPLLLSFTNMTV